ncbi:putative reverse transcriptase, RNA-dependent DNA polymerase [Tanacetum coccineum]
MRTRKSKAGTVTPFANPERQFRAGREVSPAPIHNIYTFYESELSESDIENVDIKSLTLEQYLALDQNNTRRRFTCPDDSTFEIKGKLQRELRNISFSGGPTDSAVEHISNVLKIASIFNAQESTLVQRFCPLAMIFKQLSEIQNFKQEDGESLFDTWERYNDLLFQCPFHDLNDHQKESSERQAIQNEWMKKIMISTDISLKNHDSSIKRLEQKVNHLARLPPKETDPGSFILPCIIENHSMSNALANLGASISIMPCSLFKRLGLGSLKPIKMTIEMADRSMQSPKGIKENVLVKISNFVFPVRFIILDVMEDENVSIILGRPVLATAHAKIDVCGKKISLGVGNDQIVFDINKKESRAFISPIYVINEVDKTQELVMNDEKVRDFENYLSPELAKDKKEFSMTLCDPDKRMSIGLKEFLDINDMWDGLDPGILSNEKATTEFLKSGDKIHLHSLNNLQLCCKIGFNPEAKRQFSRLARPIINGNLDEIAAVMAQPLQLCHNQYSYDIFLDYRVTLGFGSTGGLDLACPINRLPCHDGIQWVLGRITNSLPGVGTDRSPHKSLDT